jgi:hypothetical protein
MGQSPVRFTPVSAELGRRTVVRGIVATGALAGSVALSVHVGCGEAVGMRRRRSCPLIKSGSGSFAGFRFPPEVILLAVRWYLRYGLSYRDLEELLAERGIEVDHVTLVSVGATVHALAGGSSPAVPSCRR